jgi:hypothetical protein
VEHNDLSVSEIANANLPAIKLGDKAMRTHGRVLWQKYIGSIGKTTISESLMQGSPPVHEFGLHRDD